MNKLFVILFAVLLVAGTAYADAETNVHYYPAYDNAMDIDGNGEITQPPMRIKKVRYGAAEKDDPGLNSGDIVAWDTTSADGVTVSACIAATSTPCGVLVTALLTQDSGAVGRDDNWGYMAVGGYCLANLDTDECTSGQPLVISDAASAALPALGTADLSGQSPNNSFDVGILLSDPGSDTLGKVWLTLN